MSKDRSPIEQFEMIGRLVVYISNLGRQLDILVGISYDEESGDLTFGLHTEDEKVAYQLRGVITAAQLTSDEYIVLSEYITLVFDQFIDTIGEDDEGPGETV